MIPLKENIAIGVLRSDDKVLLMKQAYDLHLWTLPGGEVEAGESFADAVIREFKEETGLEVKVQGIVVVRDRPDQTCIVFGVEACGGELLESVPGEVEAVRWFDLDMVNQAGRAIIDFPALFYFVCFSQRHLFWGWIGGKAVTVRVRTYSWDKGQGREKIDHQPPPSVAPAGGSGQARQESKTLKLR